MTSATIQITDHAPSLEKHLRDHDLSEATVMAYPLFTALAELAAVRARHGFKQSVEPILSTNHKLELSENSGVEAFGFFGQPGDLSGWETCPLRGKCTALCLNLAGSGVRNSAQRGRAWKTELLAVNPVAFLRVLVEEIKAKRRRAAILAAKGWAVSLRLNGTTDLRWEIIAPWIIELATAPASGKEYPVVVYDYSKIPGRDRSIRAAGLEGKYLISYSVSERSPDGAIRDAAQPVVVVDVKRGAPLPATVTIADKTFRVVDGDVTDYRPGDPRDGAHVVLLRYKPVPGMTLADATATGFVRRIADIA
jgi:hypothetical protein